MAEMSDVLSQRAAAASHPLYLCRSKNGAALQLPLETESTEGRVLMVMNSAGLIAPPVRGISQALTWLLIGSFGKELSVLVLD